MFRIITIVWVAWRFGLDDIVLSAVAKPWARRLRWLTLWRPHRTSGEVRLRLALEHLGPIFVKFGQLLSTRRDLLPAVYANELAKLQDKVPPEDPQDIKAALSAAYHHPRKRFFPNLTLSRLAAPPLHRCIAPDWQPAAMKSP